MKKDPITYRPTALGVGAFIGTHPFSAPGYATLVTDPPSLRAGGLLPTQVWVWFLGGQAVVCDSMEEAKALVEGRYALED